MKLIHTADIHLDASFAASGLPPGFGNRRRQGLRRVFERILTRAQEWPADAVLISGDLYDHTRLSRDTIAFLREQFERIRPIPIFIAPGNRDPFTPASPYASEAWPANVFIFDETRWSAHELHQCPLTVHGFAFDGDEISENPFGALEIPEDDRVHVALGHGSERSCLPADRRDYAPFDVAEAVPRGLHYLALGHFHECRRLEGDFETTVYYAGAPEGRHFGETGPRHFVEIEIEHAEGQKPKVSATPVPCARTVYACHSLDCSGIDEAGALVTALKGLAPEDDTEAIAQVRLEGTLLPALQDTLPALEEAAAEAFLHLEVIDSSTPIEDFEDLAAENTSLGLFIKRLNQELRDAPDQAKRDVLLRAREAGLAAYRGRSLPIHGITGESP